MNLNLNFDGKTKLKDWWKQVKSLFTQVETDVNNEISARQNADETLQQNIDNEAKTREKADGTLQGKIEDEAKTRAAYDETLLSEINSEKTKRESADATLKSNIESEANFRRLAVDALKTEISREETARETADNAHKNAAVLDHPNGCITRDKLSDELKNGLHSHNNPAELGTITWEMLGKIHAHDNMELLNSITPEQIHTHWNGMVLDEISRNKMDAWDKVAAQTIDDLSGVFCFDFGNVVFDKSIDPDWAFPENQYDKDKYGGLETGDIVRFHLSSIKSTAGADEQETAALSINVGYFSGYLNLIADEPFKVGHDYVAIVSQPLTGDDSGNVGQDGEAHIILDNWEAPAGNNTPVQSQRPVTFVIGNAASGHTLGECDYVCDGVSDDVEINAAIQALPASGGTIKILGGEYILLNSLSLNRAGITLSGDGAKTKITHATPNHSLIVSANNITIKDIAIQKENAFNGSPILAEDVEGIAVQNVHISNCYYAIQFNAVRKSSIKNCKVENSSGGLLISSSYINSTYVPAEQVIISENFISGTTGNAISIGSPSKEIIISNNQIQNCNSGISVQAAAGSQISNITIASNMCINNENYGVRVQAVNSSGTSIADVFHITGNTFTGNYYGIFIAGVSGLTNFKKSIISGNALIDNDTGISLVGVGDTIINSNLCIRGDGAAADYTSAQKTIGLSGCTRCLVGHNMLRGKNYTSTNSTNIVFSDNDATTA